MQDKAFLFTHEWEAGYSNNPNDLGRETIDGISRTYHPKWDGWKLVDAYRAKEIRSINDMDKFIKTYPIQKLVMDFYKQWWIDHHCNEMSSEIALAFFDTSFMTGEAVWLLQKAINFVHHPIISKVLKEDNIWGNETRKILGFTHVLVDVFIYKRGKYQNRLQDMRSFYRGWVARTFNLGLYIKSGYNPKVIKN